MPDLNTVTITGNLTRDPELRTVGGNNTSVCDLRVAVNGREKQGDQWVDRANYFDVTIWGRQGENAHTYLEKGRPVAITGELRWREWTDKDGGKRQGVSITADTVKFLSNGNGNGNGQGGYSDGQGQQPAAAAQPAAGQQPAAQQPAAQPQPTASTGVHEPVQAPAPELVAAGATAGGGGEDDLPF